ncbi:hypothetical protein TcWFU_006757 [Taenia crassiceps]|uniref:Uncharacterized protein n=1 Tax=Taenia crassiceps TaxID=6207 RepID=A0ABR4Q546_9CEST
MHPPIANGADSQPDSTRQSGPQTLHCNVASQKDSRIGPVTCHPMIVSTSLLKERLTATSPPLPAAAAAAAAAAAPARVTTASSWRWVSTGRGCCQTVGRRWNSSTN